MGVLGAPLDRESWLDFNNLRVRDTYDFDQWTAANTLTPMDVQISADMLKNILQCLTRSQDVEKRQMSWIHHTLSLYSSDR